MIYLVCGTRNCLEKITNTFTLMMPLGKSKTALFVDASACESFDEFAALRNNDRDSHWSIQQLPAATLKKQISAMQAKYENIVIYTKIGAHLESLIQFADRLILLLSPQNFDLNAVWNITKIEKIVEHAMEHKLNLKSYSYLSKSSELYDNDLLQLLKKSQLLHFSPNKPLIEKI